MTNVELTPQLALSLIGKPVDYRYKIDDDGTKKWMVITGISDDETTIYFKKNGTGTYISASIKKIVILRAEA